MTDQNKKYIYKRVFVIDDVYEDRLTAQIIVKQHNVAGEIILMESAEQMLDYLNHLPDYEPVDLPQLILLDLNMPGISGWEFLRLFDLFKRKIKDQFSIFIVSSSINAKDRERALINEYVLDYVAKPLNKETFFKINARVEQNTRERIRYLAEALKKEKQLNLLKSRFVSLASHEFRTPVSGILSSANLLSKYTTTEEQPKRDKHINNIVSSVKILVDILNDFLSVGKIEEGKVYVRPTNFNVKEYIAQVIMEMRGITTRGQVFNFVHEGIEDIYLDPILLRHIIINLLSNAIKFSFENTAIDIRTTIIDGEFTLSVKDSGVGIPREDQEYLYDLFFRGSNVAYIEGTGLGLYIVAKYAEIMGGKVEYKTELNKGTEVILSFSKSTKINENSFNN